MDSIFNFANGFVNLFTLGLAGLPTDLGSPGAPSTSDAAGSIADDLSSGLQSILPSEGETWGFIVALILILLLIAYISREVAG